MKSLVKLHAACYGIVYKAKNLSDNTIVAIKIPADKDSNYNPYSTQNKQKAINKIRNEIKQLKKFGTQAEKNHVVPLLDWHEGLDDNRPIMVMPLSEGTLSTYVRETGETHRFTCDEFLTIIEQILVSLSFIHQKAFNVIHRDVKLDNFLIINKKVYLCDFGERKEPKHDWTVSVAGTILWGAPELFIPEKIEFGEPKRRVTHKVDIYSVGLIIYNMIMFTGNYPKAQSKLSYLSDPDGGCRENAPENFQKVGGLEAHEKASCIKYLTQLAEKNVLAFPNEFVQVFMQFLEKLLCPVIDDRLDAPGALKQLGHLKDMMHPQIIQFNVKCPETICIQTSYTITIEAQCKGLPSISKWLTIEDQTHNHRIEITEIKKTGKNEWQVTLPGVDNEGTLKLLIIPFDPGRAKTCQIQIQITPEELWKRKNYTEALLAYKHPDYLQWLRQIENESRQSEKNRKTWLRILSKVTRTVTIENRPDTYVLCGQLLKPDKPSQKMEQTKRSKPLNTFIKTLLTGCFIALCIYLGYMGQQRLRHHDNFGLEKAQIEDEKKQLRYKQDQFISDKLQFDNKVKQLESDKKQLESEEARLASEKQEIQKKKAQIEAEEKQLRYKQEQFETDKNRFVSEKKEIQKKKAQIEAEEKQLAYKKEKFASDKQQLNKKLKQFELEKARFESEKQAMNKKHLETKQPQSKKTKRVKPDRRNIERLRSKPKTLSYDDITAVVKKYNFFDKNINNSGEFSNKYVNNHDGTVTDRKTGLMWQQGGSDNYMVRDQAEEYINRLNNQKYAGYSDWRLPTVEELMSLMENKKMNGDLYIDTVFSKKQWYCWTADKRSSSSSWVVGFDGGLVRWDDVGSGSYVRAVRFGQ